MPTGIRSNEAFIVIAADRWGNSTHVIQDLLGHRNIASTTRYARVAINTIRQIQSPLELLNMEMAAPT